MASHPVVCRPIPHCSARSTVMQGGVELMTNLMLCIKTHSHAFIPYRVYRYLGH